MECPICFIAYDFEESRPKLLQCGCTICKKCLMVLGSNGEICCPMHRKRHAYNNIDDFNDNTALLIQIEQLSLLCQEHSLRADHFCPTHTSAICAKCEHLPDCPLLETQSSRFKIKVHLASQLSALRTEMNELGITLRSDYRSVMDNTENASLQMLLMTFCGYVKSRDKGVCDRCGEPGVMMVDVKEMRGYCEPCFNINPDTITKLEFSNLADRESQLRSRIYTAVRTALRQIDFYRLSLDQCLWLSREAEAWGFFKFLRIARELKKMKPMPMIEHLPNKLICPTGHEISKHRHSLRRLPCMNVLHALCDECASSMQSSIKCPLDERCYHTNFSSLPTVEWRQVADSSARSCIGDGHPLAFCGRRIEPFTVNKNLCGLIPKGKLTSIERFQTVLPSDTDERGGIPPEDAVFLRPWVINRHPNQVEALTFVVSRAVMMWGIGIASPIAANEAVRVDYCLLYEGTRAQGDPQMAQLATRDFVRSGDAVVADLYFSIGLSIPPQVPMTLKLVMRPLASSQEPLAMYHGNHIGRFYDSIGGDGTKWEFRKTEAVESAEWFSRQQEIIGPILRLIYEKQ